MEYHGLAHRWVLLLLLVASFQLFHKTGGELRCDSMLLLLVDKNRTWVFLMLQLLLQWRSAFAVRSLTGVAWYLTMGEISNKWTSIIELCVTRGALRTEHDSNFIIPTILTLYLLWLAIDHLVRCNLWVAQIGNTLLVLLWLQIWRLDFENRSFILPVLTLGSVFCRSNLLSSPHWLNLFQLTDSRYNLCHF